MSIVVGYLATPEGEAALRSAAHEAKRRGSDLKIVPSGAGDDSAFPTETHKALLDGLHYEVEGPAEDGDVAELLISTAERTDAELIVIGLRKRNPVGKLILGSNAQRILLDASCPVLAVKPDTAQ